MDIWKVRNLKNGVVINGTQQTDDAILYNRAIEIVNELAEKYKDKLDDEWQIIYNKILNLEKKYVNDGNTESVNDCIKLENLLQYFKEELQGKEEYINTSTDTSSDTSIDTSSGYCEWKPIDEEKSIYKSVCKKQSLYDGNPTESMYEFCPYCGKKIKVVE